MGSFSHSLLQAWLSHLLFSTKRFKVFTELSLDITHLNLSQFKIKAKEELKPDVCVYPNTVTPDYKNDKVKVSEMPLSAIDIISPKQSETQILKKFQVYFALGIKSCWLVTPPLELVTVYYPEPDLNNFEPFSEPDEVFDEVINIKIPVKNIFNMYG
jgi:Uma2 family endonuclease